MIRSEIEARVAEIQDEVDAEIINEQRDALYRDVLRAIANGELTGRTIKRAAIEALKAEGDIPSGPTPTAALCTLHGYECSGAVHP